MTDSASERERQCVREGAWCKEETHASFIEAVGIFFVLYKNTMR